MERRGRHGARRGGYRRGLADCGRDHPAGGDPRRGRAEGAADHGVLREALPHRLLPAPADPAAYDLPALYQQTAAGRSPAAARRSSSWTRSAPRRSRHDLAVFDSRRHLPAPPSLTVIQPAGKVAAVPGRPPTGRAGPGRPTWTSNTPTRSRPGANILLVETPTSENEGTTGFPQIVKAEEYVINHHLGGVISQSFSATEQTFPSRQSLLAPARRLHRRGPQGRDGAGGIRRQRRSGRARSTRSTYYLHAGDVLAGQRPAGHRRRRHPAAPRRATGQPTRPASVWNDTYNVATNEYIVGRPRARTRWPAAAASRPSSPGRGYQNGVRDVVGRPPRRARHLDERRPATARPTCTRASRASPPGWYPTCGTSEATPEFAGIVALADQVAGHPLGLINPTCTGCPAQHAPGIVDVTTGNNTVSFPQGGKLRHRARVQRRARL